MAAAEAGISAPLAVTQLTLTAYRNYESLRLDCDEAPVILAGPNGSGKTNLIEAISLLVPGRGLRRAPYQDFQNRRDARPWAAAARLLTGSGDMQIGTGRDPADGEGERRLVHIDGRSARGQAELATHVAMAWITPDMDRLLAEGATARRRFLDRLVYSFDPAHNARVQRYEKAMRERLRLLRDNVGDAAWLAALEDEMAQTAVAIAAARLHMVRRLEHWLRAGTDMFPRAGVSVRGAAEDALEATPALLVEDGLRDAFVRARPEDARSGTCAVGAHRSDLRVTHLAKGCAAEQCSTGEQKALLIALMLAYLRLLVAERGVRPLILLDDIAAHLDAVRRAALFEEIRDLKVQAWLTGTDRADFAALLPYAQGLQVEDGIMRA